MCRTVITCPAIIGPTGEGKKTSQSRIQIDHMEGLDLLTCRSGTVCEGESSVNVSILRRPSGQQPSDSYGGNVHPTFSMDLQTDEISIIRIVTKPNAKNTKGANNGQWEER